MLKPRLFIGSPVTSELRMHLHQSIKWKHAGIEALKNPNTLSLIHFHGNDYIGLYADTHHLTVPQLESLDSSIKQQIFEFCPKMEIQKIHCIIFPQVFIA